MGYSLQYVRAHHRNRPVAKGFVDAGSRQIIGNRFPHTVHCLVEVTQSAREPERENVRSAFDYGKAVRSERG